MFVMTTILFLTAGGCQAFIHTLVHLDCGFRLGSFFLLKPVTMGRTEGPAPFWQYWSQVALYFCWKASWELFQRSEFTKVCMKTSKYLLKLQTQNLCHSKSMNISVILVAFSLFWETIQNKGIKGVFVYNLRVVFMQLALPFQLPEHLHSTRFLPPVWLSPPIFVMTRNPLHQYHASRTNSNDIRPFFCMSSLKSNRGKRLICRLWRQIRMNSQLWSKMSPNHDVGSLKNVQLEAVGSIISVNADAKTL